jgi:hypothetical protein
MAGYSWKTNQYGLAVDSVTAFELVMPSGFVKNVTESSEPDLFFALKGGFNNFVSPSCFARNFIVLTPYPYLGYRDQGRSSLFGRC